LAATSAIRDRVSAGWRRPPLIAALVVLILLLLLVVGMLVYDHMRRDVIAKGVRIDGIAVGGLSESAARTKLESDLLGAVRQPVTVRAGKRSWTLPAADASIQVDLSNMLRQAVEASRNGSIFTRTFRSLFGGHVDRDVALVADYSHQAVRNLTAEVRTDVNRAPRDATVEPSESGLKAVASQPGLSVESDKFGARVENALLARGAARTIQVPTHPTKPAVTTSQLASKYPAYIVVDRSAFRLMYYSHLKLAKTYEIAVGMQGLETPAGLYHIQWKQVDPPWYVPKKAWAGSLAGTVVPPGPADPLKARFMSFDGGAGIHGIDPSEYSSIGHDASHGCVRMRIPEVIDLYAKTPVGTPVYIL
jgi:lipoprotein-anchoring transpeptidase ErfK/SrfK